MESSGCNKGKCIIIPHGIVCTSDVVEQYYSDLKNINLNLIKLPKEMSQLVIKTFSCAQVVMPPSQPISIHLTQSTEETCDT